ncbi:Uncharacterized protein Adt_48870 [Abeliophyllum distichum]|uniref:Protein TAR1 n=1 Tax=Abeliophyllum distichum TaxID=126358 RepID=A0ABD1NPT4_9LAMI
MAPLELSIPWRGSTKQPRRPTYSKNSHPSSSYPEGNFGGNQLLDGSISLSPLYPSQTNDLHVSIAAGLHQSFPLASPRSGIVHHLSGPRQTPWSVFQDGSNGEPAGPAPGARRCRSTPGRRVLSATIGTTAFHRHIDCPGFGRRLNSCWSTPRRSIGRPAHRRSTSDRDASPTPIRFPPDNFKHSLTLFSKFFSSFPRGTCSLSVSRLYLALDGIYPPDWGCIPKQPDSRRQRLVGAAGSEHNGALTPLWRPFPGDLGSVRRLRDASPDYNSNGEAARFSSWAFPGSLAVTRGILVSFFSSAY